MFNKLILSFRLNIAFYNQFDKNDRIVGLEINSLEITKNPNGRIFAWLMKAHYRTTTYFYLVSYLYLYSRLAEKHRRRYTGKQLL